MKIYKIYYFDLKELRISSGFYVTRKLAEGDYKSLINQKIIRTSASYGERK